MGGEEGGGGGGGRWRLVVVVVVGGRVATKTATVMAVGPWRVVLCASAAPVCVVLCRGWEEE